MSTGAALTLALVLLAANAFFVGAEFALISARRTQIEPLALVGSRRARTTLRAMEQVSLMMAGAQLGITLCSLGLGAVGEPAVASLIEGPLESAGVPEYLLHPIALVLALSVVVYLHMVLGEMVPKNIAIAGPERSALLLGPPMYAVVRVLKPLISLLNALANAVLRSLRVEPKEEVASVFSADEVAGLVAESHREGLLDASEHGLLVGALEFSRGTASRVLLPLDELVCVPRDTTPRQLEELCARTGFSRFPVVDPPSGQLMAYVHVKDLLAADADQRDQVLPEDQLRPITTVTGDEALRDVLANMQSRGAHLARVTDAATGRELGVVALEDVVEELVGEVRGLVRVGAQPAGPDAP